MSIAHDAKADLSLPVTIQSYEDVKSDVNGGSSGAGGGGAGAVHGKDKVVVPEWRIKTFTVSYKLEGIEDLTDDAFESRHSKHEYDEKLIKKWDMRRQREEYERKKLLKGRHDASYLQPPRIQNKNKKPKAEEAAANGAPVNGEKTQTLETLLQKAAEIQYIEILDQKTEAILLKQMAKIASKLSETTEKAAAAVAVAEKAPERPAEKTPTAASGRGRRTKEVQENKPPAEAAVAGLNKSKSSGSKEAPLQASTDCATTDNINNIIKTRKLLKSPVKSYPLISPLWSTTSSETNGASPKKHVLSTSFGTAAAAAAAEPRSRYAASKKLNSSSSSSSRKSDAAAAFLLLDKSCNSSSSIYDDIDLDFRKLDNEDAASVTHHQLSHHSSRQRLPTRSRSSSRSFSIDNMTKSSQSEYDGEQSQSAAELNSGGGAASLQAVPSQRKRRRERVSPDVPNGSFAKRSTKRIRIN